MYPGPPIAHVFDEAPWRIRVTPSPGLSAPIVAADIERVDKGRAASERAGVVREPEKPLRYEATAAIRGGEFSSGRKGVGGDLTKVTRLAAVAAWLALAGCASVIIMRMLAGCWAHQLMFGWRCACLLDAVYGRIREPSQHSIPPGGARFRMRRSTSC